MGIARRRSSRVSTETGVAGAVVHRAERHDGRGDGERRDRVGFDAVPVLRPQRAGGALRPARPERIRVVQMETGGGFGGKEEYPSIIAGHAALLAWKSRRPVKLVYDRAEDMVATTKRHPSRTRHRTGDRCATAKLLAMDIDFVHRRRRVPDAVAGRAVARHASTRRAVSLPEHPRARPRRRDQRAAARRVPRVRRAAEHLRARTPHGPGRAKPSA